MSFFEPWVLLRLLVGLTAVALFARAAVTSLRLVSHFDVTRATEGQLAIERQMELATSTIRVGAVVQVGALPLSVLAADRLSHSIRGAMCAYGVFQENRWGFVSLGVTAFVAILAGMVTQLCAFDRGLRGLEGVRPIAYACLLMAPLAAIDLAATASFLLRLDLGAVASCCSTQLDLGLSQRGLYASGSRALATWAGALGCLSSVVATLAASTRPRRFLAVLAGSVSVCAMPFVFDAVVLQVAPYTFEVPGHTCPFCLLHAEAWWLGYPLFASMFLATVWSAGAALAAAVSTAEVRDVFAAFARTRLRRGAAGWMLAAALGICPIAVHFIVAGGKPLFP